MAWPDCLIGGISAPGMVFYINALRAAPVADVALIYASVPFVTAFVAWVTIGERSPRRTIFASLAALLGVGVMVGGGLAGGYWRGGNLSLGTRAGTGGLRAGPPPYPGRDETEKTRSAPLFGGLAA